MMKIPKLKIDGVVLLDKPEGLSSNAALQIVKRLYQAEKAGHAGTLDPMVTGMLPICLGQATKLAEYFLAEDKCYRAVIKLGQATSTGDKEGEVISEAAVPSLSLTMIEAVLAQFRGSISQTPPMYSALKHQGQPLYKLARQGVEVERKIRQVTIYQLSLIEFTELTLTIEVKCSKGTYIRTLGEDIAKALSTVGHLTQLRRLYSGGFNPANLVSIETLRSTESLSNYLQPLTSCMLNMAAIVINAEQYQYLMHGKRVTLDSHYAGEYRLLLNDRLVAIANVSRGEIISRKMILNES